MRFLVFKHSGLAFLCVGWVMVCGFSLRGKGAPEGRLRAVA